jgi:prepilin-type N-terminal cleavage/methylation domain-containing protein
METKNINLQKTKRAGAFTLIELLVVIAIIGIIASLVVGLVGRAATARKIKRVKVELAQLETAIDSYKSKKGFFPPSNGDTNIVTTNQLFYELTGTIFTNGIFQTVNGTETIDDSTVDSYFKTKGFANSATSDTPADSREVKNFFPGLKAAQYQDVNPADNVNVQLLIVPVAGPDDIDVNGRKINPWRYNSAAPTHNPDTYDLWAEIVVAGKTNIIGNWNE